MTPHRPQLPIVEQAVALARALQSRATELPTPAERRQQAELDRMLQTTADKVTLVQLTDQAFRCRAASRTAEHLTHIQDVQGVQGVPRKPKTICAVGTNAWRSLTPAAETRRTPTERGDADSGRTDRGAR